jgi:hypothetical protein
VPTVKYVERGIVILPESNSSTASSSLRNRLPVIIAREKLFFEWRAVSFANTGFN